MSKRKLGDMCGKPIAPRMVGASSRILGACFDQQIGIEIEVENMRRGHRDLPAGWTEVDDHSLRGGIELKTSGPILAKFAEHYVARALTWLNEKQATTSIRTGLHIHVDATNLDFDERQEHISFMMAYLLVEPALYRFVGDMRQTLMFCQPMFHTPTIVAQIKDMMLSTTPTAFARKNPGRDLKYSGLNVASLAQFGTVEFRHAGMSFDYEWFIRWIEMVVSVMKYAEGKTPADVYAAIVRSPDEVAAEIFQENIAKLSGPYNPALALLFAPSALRVRKLKSDDWAKPRTEAMIRYQGAN